MLQKVLHKLVILKKIQNIQVHLPMLSQNSMKILKEFNKKNLPPETKLPNKNHNKKQLKPEILDLEPNKFSL